MLPSSCAGPSAPFEANDLLVAAQLATHTALGIDKAVLYGREAYIADELQRTMLPDSLPQPTGVRLASRYLPAAETARVGGDWYDAIPLPGSRVALVVGDVMGHSMTSAAIMGQLRTTAQTLAGLDLPPQEVLHHLDEQAQRLGSDRMATCLYAVYDPVAHRITIANAGHPPPVLLHLGGRAEVLRVPPGAPIGVGGVDFEAVELDAPSGATLLLYTDGLVESRLRDVWTGIEQLRERLAATARLTGPDHSPPLEALCDDVLDMLGPGDRDDDIALLAARFDGIAPSDVAYWFLEPEDSAPGRARRLARRALSRWGLDDLSDSVELLVSEVVTNAVRYAERPVTLRLLRTDILRCEVGDDAPQLPRQRRARDMDEGGRGLFLVNRLARRWGRPGCRPARSSGSRCRPAASKRSSQHRATFGQIGTISTCCHPPVVGVDFSRDRAPPGRFDRHPAPTGGRSCPRKPRTLPTPRTTPGSRWRATNIRSPSDPTGRSCSRTTTSSRRWPSSTVNGSPNGWSTPRAPGPTAPSS